MIAVHFHHPTERIHRIAEWCSWVWVLTMFTIVPIHQWGSVILSYHNSCIETTQTGYAADCRDDFGVPFLSEIAQSYAVMCYNWYTMMRTGPMIAKHNHLIYCITKICIWKVMNCLSKTYLFSIYCTMKIISIKVCNHLLGNNINKWEVVGSDLWNIFD